MSVGKIELPDSIRGDLDSGVFPGKCDLRASTRGPTLDFNICQRYVVI